MQVRALGWGLAVALLSSGALAAPQGSSVGRGGSGPGSGGASPAGGGKVSVGSNPGEAGLPPDADVPDGAEDGAPTQKKWEVEGIVETHRLIRQSDLDGAGANKTLNAAFVYGRYELTPNDRLTVRVGAYQRFIADADETGFRLDDAVAYYTHSFDLPNDWSLALQAQASAPTSFASQKAGLITAPRGSVRVGKRFGRLSLTFRTYDEYQVMRYDTAAGGSPNARNVWAQTLGAEWRIPKVEVLTLGTAIYNEYVWYYDNQDSAPKYGAATAPYFDGQPVAQSYGGEVYLRYDAPRFAGIATDLTVAFAQGDPTLGFTSTLHDGVRHVYPFFWRQNSEVYAALSARY